jgi:competence protein ComER
LKVGFIGLGNLGSTLAAGLLERGAIAAEQILLTNRSPQKAEDLVSRFPGAEAVRSNRAVAERSDIIFPSVRTDQVPSVLKEVSPCDQMCI